MTEYFKNSPLDSKLDSKLEESICYLLFAICYAQHQAEIIKNTSAPMRAGNQSDTTLNISKSLPNDHNGLATC